MRIVFLPLPTPEYRQTDLIVSAKRFDNSRVLTVGF